MMYTKPGVKTMSPAKSGALSFSASIDRFIIEGFIEDQRNMFKKLRTMGFSKSSVMNRAKQLGLSDQFVKKCSVGDHKVAMRNCLGCNAHFLSVGFQNRLCPRCKNRR